MACDSIIFYVEDDSATIRLVEKHLQHNDYPAKLVYFNRGETFLDFLYHYSDMPQPPDQDIVIILDMNLISIHGITVLEAIRQSPHAWIRQLPVIIFTVTIDPHDQEQCESLGCSAYLQKSFEDDRLIQALQKIEADKACAYES